jgi:hypothetical protein
MPYSEAMLPIKQYLPHMLIASIGVAIFRSHREPCCRILRAFGPHILHRKVASRPTRTISARFTIFSQPVVVGGPDWAQTQRTC